MMEDRKCELPRLVKFCVKRELQSLQLLVSPKLDYSGFHIAVMFIPAGRHQALSRLKLVCYSAGYIINKVQLTLAGPFRKTNLGVYDMTSIQIQDHGRWL